MSTPLFTDKSQQPNHKLISEKIGKNFTYWEKFTQSLKDRYPELILEWKFYRDAGRWLLPVSGKKKNLCWISFIDDTFMVGFWFGHKLTPAFESSDLPEKIKTDFRNAEQNKMGRGLSIKVYSETHLDEVFELLKFKAQLK